jgi:hypothetical protein
MKSFKYELLPPLPDSSLDRKMVVVLRRLFPVTPFLWESTKSWATKLRYGRGYDFCRFATSAVMYMYRGWLKRSAMFALADDPVVRPFAVKQTVGAFNYTLQFNCPPRSCRFRLRSKMPEHGVKKCQRRYCPHCHIKRVFRAIYSVLQAVARVRPYYDNLVVPVYEMRFDSETKPKDVRAAVNAFIDVVKKEKLYLGGIWYFRPIFDKGIGAAYWRVRILVLAGSSFYLDRSLLTEHVVLLKSRPATNLNIYKQVSKLFAWGKNAFWFCPELAALWNNLAGSNSCFPVGALGKKENHSIYARFKKNARKYKKNLLFRTQVASSMVEAPSV